MPLTKLVAAICWSILFTGKLICFFFVYILFLFSFCSKTGITVSEKSIYVRIERLPIISSDRINSNNVNLSSIELSNNVFRKSAFNMETANSGGKPRNIARFEVGIGFISSHVNPRSWVIDSSNNPIDQIPVVLENVGLYAPVPLSSVGAPTPTESPICVDMDYTKKCPETNNCCKYYLEVEDFQISEVCRNCNVAFQKLTYFSL